MGANVSQGPEYRAFHFHVGVCIEQFLMIVPHKTFFIYKLGAGISTDQFAEEVYRHFDRFVLLRQDLDLKDNLLQSWSVETRVVSKLEVYAFVDDFQADCIIVANLELSVSRLSRFLALLVHKVST
jgi:hypothetical protein